MYEDALRKMFITRLQDGDFHQEVIEAAALKNPDLFPDLEPGDNAPHPDEQKWWDTVQGFVDLCLEALGDKLLLPEERVRHLLCAAFEGGSNYWCEFARWDLPLEVDLKDEKISDREWGPLYRVPFIPGCGVWFSDDEPKEWRLDLEALKRGCRLLRDKHPRHWADVMLENDDATTGDVFLQLCLFGEVVYG